MSARSLLDRLAGRAVERAFGEAMLVLPMKVTRNAAATADPDRAAATIQVVISIAPEDRALFADRKGGANTLGPTKVTLAGTWATVTAAEIGRLGYLPIQGDVMVLTDRPGQARYRVSQVDLDDLGAVTLQLTKEAAP